MASIAQESVAQDVTEKDDSSQQLLGNVWMGRRSSDVWSGGFRFTTIPDIASGDTIDTATLTLEFVSTSGTAVVNSFCEAADTATTFDASNRPSVLTPTTASTALSTPFSAGQNANDVTNAVQEVINRGGWAANNDINILCLHGEAAGTPVNLEQVDDKDRTHSSPVAAKLDIDFTAASAGSLLLLRRRRGA